MNIFKKDWIAHLLILLGVIIIVAAPKVIAATFDTTGNPGDNTSGEAFTAYSTLETLDYKNPQGTSQPTTMPASDFDFTISPDYGFSGPVTPGNHDVTAGDIVTHEMMVITNEGDATVDTIWTYYFTTGESGAINWTVEVRRDDDATLVMALLQEIASTETITLEDDSDTSSALENRNIRVTVPVAVEDAPDGSLVHIYTTIETAVAAPAGKYTGGNTLTYGGTSEVTLDFEDSTSGPILDLTRVATIDAPHSPYAGTHEDAVPGAIITFTMTYSNEGSGTAESVVFIDKVPSNTHLACINTEGDTTNVNITNGTTGDASGWSVYYFNGDPSPSDRTYGATSGWTLIGILTTGAEMFPGPGTTYATGAAAYDDANYVKWEKYQIDGLVYNKRLTWGVTID